MKKLIILFLIITSAIFSQGWNNAVQTTIPYSIATGTGIDQCANKDGIHVLVDYYSSPSTYYLKYYLLNSSGSVVRNYTFENQEVEFASIDGNNDRIYVVYKLGNQIKTRKSTDAGENWTNITDISIGNNACNNVDIFFGKDDNALHVVWATQDNGNDYETYYRSLASDNSWGTQKTVTDYGSEVGGFPTVSKSQDRIHVSYNTGQYSDPAINLGDANSRDKYQDNWQTPQLVFTPQSFRERVHAGSSKLFDFYYKLESGGGQYHSDLYVKERSLSGDSWSSGSLLQAYGSVYNIVSATNTTNGETNIVYEGSNSVILRNYSGSSWSSESTVGTGYHSPKISSTSNDLFVTWGSGYVFYRQYDTNPLTPVNFSGSTYNNHPNLIWSLNNEPDIDGYEIWIKFNEGNWNLLYTTNGQTNNFVDNGVELGSPFIGVVNYKIRAKDKHQTALYSGYTDEISYRYSALNKNVASFNSPIIFELNSNYPNPFNPITKITYSLEEDAKVYLKVYDMLGTEVAVLVNDTKSAGYYETTFDASDLSSGIYIYRITALGGEKILYTKSKQMLLIK